MSKWDETDPYTDYELGSSRPHGLLPKPEPEPNWRSMYEETKRELEALREVLKENNIIPGKHFPYFYGDER
jgi:hypothetical protein